MKNYIILFFILAFNNSSVCQQIDFFISPYLNSTFAKTNQEIKTKMLGYGFKAGNIFTFKKKKQLIVEAFFTEHRLFLEQGVDYEFNLHNTLGFKIKPSIVVKKISLGVSFGVMGVYAYQKNNVTQKDHFDQAVILGLNTTYKLTKKIRMSLDLDTSKFESQGRNIALKSFATLQLGVQYLL